MTPSARDLWFVPLGGTGEIGMNLNLYGHAGQWLMVDCGVTFARGDDPPPHVQMADPSFIAARRDQLVGLVVTHAHEDHVGAVALLWRQLRCPVWTTRFTAEVLKRKLAEHGLLDTVPIHIVEPGGCRTLGNFELEWIGLTHSVPEPQALLITTAAGNIFHTGDWKLDPEPVLGDDYAEARYRQLGADGVDVMVCDSTNATVQALPRSEGQLFAGLLECVQRAEGRVVVTCFGSNVARLHTIARVAQQTDRQMGVLGRSLENMVGAARQAGVWEAGALVGRGELGYLPRGHCLAVATGSQGESRTALGRLASDRHPEMTLEAGDTVIFSSRVIPGNEDEVGRLITQLQRKGVAVIQDRDAEIHASGHPTVSELTQMYQWVQPRLVIPVHGEPHHLDANAAIARETCGARTLVGRNGDVYLLAPQAGIRRAAVAVGRLGWDGRRLVGVTGAEAVAAGR